MTNKHEQHVRALQEMRRVMIENDNWENLKRFIEAVTAGGMAIQMLDEKAFTQPKTGHWEWVQYDYNPKLGNWHCSECRCVVVECVGKEEKGGIPLHKYCPQCGAKIVEPQETETWNGYHGQITAPKGSFERIFNEADDDNDI